MTVAGEEEAPSPFRQIPENGGRRVGDAAIAPGNGPGVHLKEKPASKQPIRRCPPGGNVAGVAFVEKDASLIELGDQVEVPHHPAAGDLRDPTHRVEIGFRKGQKVPAEMRFRRPPLVVGGFVHREYSPFARR